MNKPSGYRIFALIFCAILCLFANTYSQSKEVSIEYLNIGISGGAANPYAVLDIKTNVFADRAGVSWSPIHLGECLPCASGDVISTSFYSTSGLRFGRALDENRILYYEFVDTYASSPSITIPYFSPARRRMTFEIPATINGQLKVYEQSVSNGTRTMLYTAEINLIGAAQVIFSPLSAPRQNAQTGWKKTTIFGTATYSFSASNAAP